jgi:hypothetical protein
MKKNRLKVEGLKLDKFKKQSLKKEQLLSLNGGCYAYTLAGRSNSNDPNVDC